MERENDMLDSTIRSSRVELPVDNWAEAEQLLKDAQGAVKELEDAGASLQKDLHQGRLLASGMISRAIEENFCTERRRSVRIELVIIAICFMVTSGTIHLLGSHLSSVYSLPNRI